MSATKHVGSSGYRSAALLAYVKAPATAQTAPGRDQNLCERP